MDRKILKNSGYLFISNILTRVLNAVSVIILAGYIDSKGYGMFSVALAFAYVAGYFTDTGLVNTFIREASKPNIKLSIIISSYIKLRIVLLVVTIGISIIIINLFYNDGSLLKIMYYLCIPMIIGLTLQSIGTAYYQIKEQMGFIALIRSLSGILSSMMIILGMNFKWGISTISLSFGLSYLVVGILAFLLLFYNLEKFHFYLFEKKILAGIMSFIISGLITILLPQLGVLIIEKTLSLEEVGLFSVALRIPVALYALPGVLAGAFFPVLYRHYNSGNIKDHEKLNVLQVKFMSMLGFLLSIPFLFYSEYIIEILFGNEWIKAGEYLQLLSLVLVLQSINFPLADGLTTSGKQAVRTKMLIYTVIVSFLSYLLFSTYLGLIGATIAALLTESFFFIGLMYFQNNKIRYIREGLAINLIGYIIILLLGSFIKLDGLIGILLYPVFYAMLILLLDKQIYCFLKKRLLSR
ncbi:oligosaccharide flippase family protein [Cytobacillus firmus]|uniref:oligosaccharide flippase family protein n=1 Tax=Cytobacillus firmus TaxID=1399 RepID=UPI002494F79C|nr:oligosaccharide flippase family protein [Cytobacillus firmus]